MDIFIFLSGEISKKRLVKKKKKIVNCKRNMAAINGNIVTVD